MSYSALTVAKYFLSVPDEDSGELISNLKLQKLLYYAQGHAVALGLANGLLFKDKLYAWKHGPVVKTVYNHYAVHGRDALPRERPPTTLSREAVSLLDEIYRVYGRYSAWALREMTHREAPWLRNYKPDILDIEIPLQHIKEHFSKNAQV